MNSTIAGNIECIKSFHLSNMQSKHDPSRFRVHFNVKEIYVGRQLKQCVRFLFYWFSTIKRQIKCILDLIFFIHWKYV